MRKSIILVTIVNDKDVCCKTLKDQPAFSNLKQLFYPTKHFPRDFFHLRVKVNCYVLLGFLVKLFIVIFMYVNFVLYIFCKYHVSKLIKFKFKI